MTIPPDELKQVLALYEQGLYLQAYSRSQSFGPLEQWEGTAAMLMAGRLAVHLGAQRLSRRLLRRAWRQDPTHPGARYFRTRVRLERRGPLAAWALLERESDLPEAEPELRAHWLSLRAIVAALLRDFDMAEMWLARAQQILPADPWLYLEQAVILEREDRYEEALAAAQRALTVQPWHRAGVEMAAHVLQLLNRDEEALELLSAAAEKIESAAVVAQLMLAQTEQGRWGEAWQNLDRFERLSPLREKEQEQWLAGLRSDIAYHRGDLEQALQFARLAEDPFHQAIGERLERNLESGRVLLPVGFVRQHHMTCVPATLAAISRFWSMPADHLAVAEAICYDGTSAHSERNWAQQNGWVAREFTVTWESALALLDRGIPFTLTTANATNAHEQAVIGYDRLRGVLLIRDPYQRHFGELLAEDGLARLCPIGPRGMALVPREQSALLEGLDLPEAELHDPLHQLQGALLRHDRTEAQRLYETLCAAAPDHRLTLQARRSLAAYDSDPTELLACAERLLELYPEDGALQLLKLSALRDQASREERLALLKRLGERKAIHPVFWQQYAQELAPDAREHRTVFRLLHRAIRAQPADGGSIYLLARLLWDQRRLDEALRLFRIAACLEDKNEAASQGYFYPARHLKQTGAALKLLNDRFRRFGARSSQPARTLFWALSELNRAPEAFRVLESALRLRPEDGELRLFAVEACSRYGDFARAAEHLEAAKGRSQRVEWLRAAAELAERRGELAEALVLRRQVVEAEPLSVEDQRVVGRLMEATDSRAAAVAHLRSVVDHFPHHYRLHQLWIEWQREEAPAVHEAAIRQLIEINPADAWARQELALALARQERIEEALAECDLAARLHPASPSRLCVQGQVLAAGGRMAEARAAYREAITLSVDTEFAIGALVEACESPAARREALAFVEGELVRQTILGDGLLAFRALARRVLAPDELLASLRRALRARPDLWHAWSAVTQQLIGMDRLREAESIARQATDQFPLLARLWLDLAEVHRAARDRAGEREALQHALRISPGWGAGITQLAALHERHGEFETARQLLEQAVARTPLDPRCHGWLAQILWRLGEREAALARVERALELAPGYEWAWGVLPEWSRELGHGDRAIELARQLAERRPGEARSWLILARLLPDTDEESLAALERAIQLNPRLLDAYEMKAGLLASAGRFDEALAACRPAVWGETLPPALRARAAWIEAERGDRAAAIAQMRALVEDDPHFVRGWTDLARWYNQSGAHADYLDAAQRLAQLEPQNPQSFALLADARRRTGDGPGAKTAFRRAFDLAPDYAFAGLNLFDIQLEAGELEPAGETLVRLRTHVGGEWVLARAVQLAARRGDRAAALQGLRDLCVTKFDAAWPFDAALQAIAAAGWADAVETVFEEALQHPEVNPRAGGLWVRHRRPRGDWYGLEPIGRWEARLSALLDRGAVGREAMVAYLEKLAQAGHLHQFRRLVDRHAGQLHPDMRTWARVGHAFLAAGDLRRIGPWLADWQERADLEPWMLLPLAVALHAAPPTSESVAAAAAVSRHALTLPPDSRTACHAVWLAVDAAASGSPGPAEPIDAASLNAYYRFLHALAEVAAEVQALKPGERAAALVRVRRRLQATAPPATEFRCPALRRAHRRLVLRIARDVGGTPASVWACYEIAAGWLRSPARKL